MPFDAEDRPPSPPAHANRHMTSSGDSDVAPYERIVAVAVVQVVAEPVIAFVGGCRNIDPSGDLARWLNPIVSGWINYTAGSTCRR
jgi:hypothetical protein